MARRRSPYLRARRDVRLSFAPEFRSLKRERGRLQSDYGQFSEQAGNIYQALQDQLAPMGGEFREASRGISEGLQGDLSKYMGLLSGTPAGEQAAAAGLFGNIGAGGLTELAAQRARNLAYQTSGVRQAGIEQMTTQRNLLEDLQNRLDEMRDERGYLSSQMPALIRQRMDELRSQALSEQLARQEMESNRALAQFLSGQIGGFNFGGGGGGGGGGRGGGGRRRKPPGRRQWGGRRRGGP